jgi:hypothetical protein
MALLTTRARSLLFLAGIFGGAAACGTGSDSLFGAGGHGGGTSHASASHGSSSSGGVGAGGTGGTGAGGAGGCKSAADCDDGFSCTVDTCTAGVCSHSVGPNSGATACPAGKFCEVHSGCIPGMACAGTAQCVQSLGSDPCKTNLACDPALSICTYQILDKDGDGHPPPVCGGDDCDDGDPARYPGHAEVCDGKDNDCDGNVDDGAQCVGLLTCQSGSCACPPDNTCGTACVNKKTNHDNCGSCGNACPSAATCVDGLCMCSPGATVCGGQCVDITKDPQNCNGCGNTCAAGYACNAGVCACLKTSCGGACVDTSSDPGFCGSCTTKCPAGGTCQGGTCKCPTGLTVCGAACVDLKTDPKNCGGCNTSCSACQAGTCVTCPVVDLFIEQDLSGSMTTSFGTSPTRWDAVRMGINAFASAPQSAGMGLGIGYFPLVGPGTPCTTNAQCGTFGVCTGGICQGTGGTDSCLVSDYAVPSVPIALLPGNAAAIQASTAAHMANGGTPQEEGLEGALSYAKSWAISHPTHKVAVLLITDGLPNECSPNMNVATDTANIAAVYAAGSPAIKTHVIGIAADITQAQWDPIAVAGGTGSVHVALDPSAVVPALNAVRAAAGACP